MDIEVFENENILFNALADFIAATVEKVLSQKDVFHIALSGGNSPKGLYSVLSSKPYKDSIPWDKLRFYFCDERYVPYESEENNARMIQEQLFDELGIKKTQIHIIDTSLKPEVAATSYFTAITKQMGAALPVFDMVLLGLGSNAHTASLFPNTPIVFNSEAEVSVVHLLDKKSIRISMTAPLINLASNIIFLAYGSDKKQAVKTVIENIPFNPELFPGQLIEPMFGDLYWYLDIEAASAIDLSEQ